MAVWKTGTTYEYDYIGFIATGMFGLSPKASGGSIEGRLIVEAVDRNTINVAVSPCTARGSKRRKKKKEKKKLDFSDLFCFALQLMNVKAKMFNEDVPSDLMETKPGAESQIHDKEYLEKPLQMKMVDGKVGGND